MQQRRGTSSAALVPVYERVLGLEHPDTLAARSYLAFWTGEAGMRRVRGTSSRRSFQFMNESEDQGIRRP